jgi:hypothetical protein
MVAAFLVGELTGEEQYEMARMTAVLEETRRCISRQCPWRV